MGSYRRLTVWQVAHALACDVYAVTRSLAPVDRFGLGDQMRRSALSIGANIAEGCGRNGDRELSRYISISLGSANELHYLLLFARDAGALARELADPLADRAESVCRMLAALHKTTSKGSMAAK